MPRKPTKLAEEFRNTFGYFGKLTKEAMGKELWNEYYKMRSKNVVQTPEYKKNLKKKKLQKRQAASERMKERHSRGYHLMTYCCDDISLIENYEKAAADKFIGWHCHHRLETHNSDGERRSVNISAKELRALGMYYERPASELILMTSKEHLRLHNLHHGEPMSEEEFEKFLNDVKNLHIKNIEEFS